MEGEKSTYDLTPAMAPFLDVHMMSPLLDFLREVSWLDNIACLKIRIMLSFIVVLSVESSEFSNW